MVDVQAVAKQFGRYAGGDSIDSHQLMVCTTPLATQTTASFELLVPKSFNQCIRIQM